jgi:hypothetical protein
MGAATGTVGGGGAGGAGLVGATPGGGGGGGSLAGGEACGVEEKRLLWMRPMRLESERERNDDPAQSHGSFHKHIHTHRLYNRRRRPGGWRQLAQRRRRRPRRRGKLGTWWWWRWRYGRVAASTTISLTTFFSASRGGGGGLHLGNLAEEGGELVVHCGCGVGLDERDNEWISETCKREYTYARTFAGHGREERGTARFPLLRAALWAFLSPRAQQLTHHGRQPRQAPEGGGACGDERGKEEAVGRIESRAQQEKKKKNTPRSS